MSEPHVIRLRGPWEYLPLARVIREVDGNYRSETHGLPPGGKVQAPSDWGDALGADFRGCVRYTRRFNCPTNLGPGERVWLVVDGVDYSGQITLNDRPVGAIHGSQRSERFDVTPLLQPQNVLVIDVTLSAEVFRDPNARPGRAGAAGGLIGEVRLEIA